MFRDIDPFAFYRWLLFIIGTVYTVIQLGRTAYSWFEWFWTVPRGTTVRRYAAVQLLRIRLRRFTLDLMQIAVLTALFFGLVWLHHRLGFVG